MSDQTAQKGFRQAPKPTKGQVQKENQMLAGQLQTQLQFMMQQNMNMMGEMRRLMAEVTAMANLHRCVEKEAPIAKGDQVMIDYVGQIKNDDGEFELFQGGFGLGYIVEIGSNSLVGGFEEALIGCTSGDRKTVEVTFPDNYPDHLKSREAKFEVKVIRAWEALDPENTIDTIHQDLQKAEQEKKQAAEEAAKAEAGEETPSTDEGQEETKE